MFLLAIYSLSIGLLLYGAYLSFRLLKLSQEARAWSCVISAFLFAATLIAYRVYQHLTDAPSDSIDPVSSVLTLGIAVSIVAGVSQFWPFVLKPRMFEDAALSSESRFRELMDNCGGTAYKIIIDDARFEYVSPSIKTQLGYEPEEVMAYSGPALAHKLLHPDDAIRMIESSAALIDSYHDLMHGAPIEYRIRHKDGSYRWFGDKQTILRDPKTGRATALIGNTRDITESKVAQHALEESESRFQNLLRSLDDVVWTTTVGGKRVLYLNPAAERAYGRSVHEFIENPRLWIDMVHPDDKERVLELARQLPEQREIDLEFRILRPNGDVRWMFNRVKWITDTNNQDPIVSGISTDITERRIAEEALRESEERYRTVVEHASEAIVILDSNGRLQDVNAMACAISGYERSALLTVNAAELLTTGEPDEANDGNSAPVFERRLIRNDGSTIPVEMSFTHLPDGRLLAMVRDITERKKVEQAMRAASRIEATATLAGGVAHDFNNLMVAVTCNAAFLKNDLGEDHPSIELVDEIFDAATKAGELAQQVLAYGRGGKYQPEVVSLNAVVQEVVQIQRRAFPADIEIEFRLCDTLRKVHADSSQLGQIVMNLCKNASEAITGRGTIAIITENVVVSRENPIIDRQVPPGDYVRLTVRDTGVGIDEEAMGKVFEPYFSRKADGRGLGLAATYGIVKNHLGYIYVSSHAGEGAEFRVYLPAVLEPNVSQDRPAESPASGRNGTILVVDDEEPVRDAVVELLHRLGYRASAARNGAEAMEILTGPDDEVELVILDLSMPEMDGYEAFTRIRDRHPDLFVIVSSAYALDDKTSRLRDDGKCRFVSKPFDPESFGNVVRQCLDRVAETSAK